MSLIIEFKGGSQLNKFKHHTFMASNTRSAYKKSQVPAQTPIPDNPKEKKL
jgi:hypothetical protein